jgi:flavin reductase (DIM6/NTAB) family NADH-FMN oxidoreductase RutF
MPVEAADFRRALGHFAAGVTVVTTKLADGKLAGITVTAFSSLSLDPPLVLICIDKRARFHGGLQKGGVYAVNMLADGQELVSRRFATRGPDPFHETGYREGAIGCPILDGVIAVLECRIVDLLPGGDHTIFVGEVESTSVQEGKPLLYFRGGYAQLS